MFRRLRSFFGYLSEPHSARNSSMIIVVLSLLSKCLGYGRVLLIAFLFGASAAMDAFNLASTLIILIPTIITGVVDSAIYPRIVQSDSDTARVLLARVVVFPMIFLLGCYVVLFFYSEEFVSFFARNLDDQRLRIAGRMLRLMLPYGVVAFVQSLLGYCAMYRGRYTVQIVSNSAMNFLFVPILLLLYPVLNVYSLPVSFSLVFCILTFIMWRMVGWVPVDVRGRVPADLSRRIFWDSLYCIAMSNLTILYNLVDKYFASSLAEGNISAISYSALIQTLPVTLVAPTILMYLSKASLAVMGEDRGRGQLRSALNIGWCYFFPLSIFISSLAFPLVKLLLGYGAFDDSAVGLTAACLRISALVLPFAVGGTIIGRYSQALGKLRIGFYWAIFSLFLNAFLDWLFVPYWGAPGLVGATVLMSVMGTVLMIFLLAREVLPLVLRDAVPSSVFALLWGGFFYVFADASFFWVFGGAVVLAAHFFVCDRLGFLGSVPCDWRPWAVARMLWNKAVAVLRGEVV